jgi:hypothetical protein
MKRIISAIASVVVLLPLTALAQATEPETTITIEEAERINVQQTGPGMTPISLTRLEVAESLIDIRADFTELTVAEADGL